ncbi:TadA family conjugal transfer-associated ATPase [Quadrisphaera sp. DSM 44207]|uniref:TadA family conjugal transfer-associated ATPase n=1 Tax=Quadrisphaera sp. DSM 44207 TaxID=1881057 RepID=UPI00088497DC|nr:TadA family conjugal transfer-associated ATPase [Quadrisphaera sp. DSM 44207]SDQ17785.1 pilus assembly protein CpaF [Quadrisphaera sp. DSM 44207]
MSRRGASSGAPGAPPGALVDRVRTGLPGPAPGGAELVSAVAATSVLGADGVLDASRRVGAQILGAGPLQPLLDAPGVTDVLVNGAGSVWVDRGEGPRRVDLDLGGEAALRALAVRLAAVGGRRLDESSPWVDARLPDGVRLHAVLPPLSPDGTLLSLRVPRRRAFSLEDLVAAGAVPPSWAPVLRALVRRRLSFLVSGGTGSGKTTVLSSLLGLADPFERLLLVEDAGELAPVHPHVVRLQARHGNVEGAGAVGLDDLVRQALRMRPDRIVVGECRGAEVRDLLAALNTGHEGGCGTVHANAAADVPARLEALGALAGLDRAALAAQAASALHVVLHLRRDAGLRRVAEVGIVARDRHGALAVVPALSADPDDPAAPGAVERAWPELAQRLGLAGEGRGEARGEPVVRPVVSPW